VTSTVKLARMRTGRGLATRALVRRALLIERLVKDPVDLVPGGLAHLATLDLIDELTRPLELPLACARELSLRLDLGDTF